MKQNLNEQIARIKQLLTLTESPTVEESGIIEEQLAAFIKKLLPTLENKFISAIEAKLSKKIATATDAEITNAFKSAELATIRKEIAAAVYAAEKNMIDDVYSKYNMSVPGDASKAYSELQRKGLNKSILRDVTSEWKAGKSSTSKPNPTATVMGGLDNLASKVTIQDIMKHVDADPIFKTLLKNKKGSRETLENWIEVNSGDMVSKDEIITKLTPWFERLAKSPDPVVAESASKISKIFKIAKMGGDAAEVTKGIMGWSFVLITLLVMTGIITLQDALKFYLCKITSNEKYQKMLGCNSESSPVSGGSSNNSGGKGRFN